jgi:hypothetical protein
MYLSDYSAFPPEVGRPANDDVRERIAAAEQEEAGSAESQLFDFVRDSDAGDTTSADLDAITYVVESGSTGADALITWSALQDAIDGD